MVTIQHIADAPSTYLIRWGPEHEDFGDAFDTLVVAQEIGDRTVHFVGLRGSITGSVFREIERLMLQRGYEHGVWERIKDGRKREVRWNIKHSRLEN